MMIKLFVFTFFFAFTTVSFNTQSAQFSLSNIKSIKDHADCFSNVFASYDSWFNFLYTNRQNRFKRQGIENANVKLDEFERNFKNMFPIEDYELAKKNLSCNFITYYVNGKDIKGVLITPKTSKEKLPVIIYNRGGTRGLGSLVFGHIAHELFPLALEGFAIIASEYREDEQYGSDNIDEVTALFDIIDNIPMLASDKVGRLRQ